MEETEYRAAEGLNYSNFKHLRVSPLHYQHKLTEPTKDMPAWAMGRLIHALVFEPFTFDHAFMVWEGRKDKRTAAYKEALEEAMGRDIISAAQHEQGAAVAARIIAHPTMAALLSRTDVQCEVPLFWDEDPVGLCKGKPDLFLVDGDTHLLLDLKTFNTTDAHAVQAAAFRFGWHLQAAHYLAGMAATYGTPTKVEAYMLIAEQEAPHDVRLFTWDRLSLRLANDERDRLLALLATCKESGQWPGRGEYGDITPPRLLLNTHDLIGD